MHTNRYVELKSKSYLKKTTRSAVNKNEPLLINRNKKFAP